MRASLERNSTWPVLTAMALTFALSLLAVAAPLRLPEGQGFPAPLFPLIALFVWSVRRPHFVPPWLIFIVGLFQDLLTGGPLGMWALSYLLAFAIARLRSTEPSAREFILLVARFSVMTGIASLVAWVTGSLSIGQPADPTSLVTEAVITLIVFPAFCWLFARKRERTTFS
ncbi:rod shape-determining protein MreD [Glycocaulis sp.]|uniref:rod shape-determining protein MreD n=1 Tax=Glycocaulis sp. TaxID=1969725 RepID=UPI003D2093C2